MKTMSRVQSRTAAIFFALRLSQMSKKNGVCKAGGRSYRRAPGNPAAILSALGFMVLLVFAASHPDTGYAAFPGANGKIAFHSDRDGNFEIYVMNPDGTGHTNLTNNSATDINPAWSPDGTKIAFQSDRDGNTEIYVMNADGSGQTRLTNNPAGNDNPDWQPLPIPFAAFDVEVEIELGPVANEDEFEVKGTFTLGADSNGIEILTEIVSLELTGGAGSFSTTIPAGSFVQTNSCEFGEFEFEDVVEGVSLRVKIRPLGGDSFEFRARGEGADLTGIANPVTVKLTIGNNGGSATVTAEFE